MLVNDFPYFLGTCKNDGLFKVNQLDQIDKSRYKNPLLNSKLVTEIIFLKDITGEILH